MPSIFSLEGKGLKLDTAADIDKHIQPLKDSHDVEEIRFHGNTLGVEACEALAKVLETKPTIRIANLADIFTSRLLSEIPPALDSLLKACLKLPNLHTINLSDNAFGLNTVEPLRPFLSQHTPLQHLILNNNGLGPAAGTLVAEALTQLADRKAAARQHGTAVPDLETVICGRNRLEAGSMAAWTRAYTAHSRVREVKMVQNGIRQEGIAALLRDGLGRCAELRVLDLQDNTFTAVGARALAEVVGRWPALEQLGVGDCLLGARGGVALAEALKRGGNERLQVLRLQYNEIDARGVKALAGSVKAGALPGLKRVELNGNKFDEEEPAIEELKAELDARREKAGAEDEGEEDGWGLDELDDLEEEDSDEEEQAEDEEDAEEESVLKQADEAEDENVAQEQDEEVDKLANMMNKTELK